MGHMDALGFDRKNQANLENLTQDVLKSSEIEGEILPEDQVRSSIARNLGLDIAGLVASDKNVDGVVEMMLDASHNFAKDLSKERLFNWHGSLFPTGRRGMNKISVGAWRNDEKGEMQVVSGAYGREKVHFEAPHARVIEKEMAQFIDWFNEEPMDLVLKAAIAHLWFVTIHPFEDGNGRITRALSDMLLARSENSSNRFYSISSQIRKERNEYYRILEHTQKNTELDITLWLEWFLKILNHAFDVAEISFRTIFSRINFWEQHARIPLNERQRMMIDKLLNGFIGNLTSSKWAKITKCSQDTALRDITELLNHEILIKEAGGRSTNYRLGPLMKDT
jgi:Fic family protein